MKRSLAVPLIIVVGLSIVSIVLSNQPSEKPEYYFWNEVTGETQWEDPGDVPFEDENGVRFWLDADQAKLMADPQRAKYVWVEHWSDEHQRYYFYNQETKHSTWDRPADLGWRRIKASHDEL